MENKDLEYYECRVWTGKDFCKKKFNTLTAWILHFKDEHKEDLE